MTAQELVQKHGEITVQNLPVRTGPRFGTRVFTDDEEERIWLFVKHQDNIAEVTAVHCRTTKATIYNAVNRVTKRMNRPAEQVPA